MACFSYDHISNNFNDRNEINCFKETKHSLNLMCLKMQFKTFVLSRNLEINLEILFLHPHAQ